MKNLFNKKNLYRLGVASAILVSVGITYNVGYNQGESRTTNELNGRIQRVSSGLKANYQNASKKLEHQLTTSFIRKGMSPETAREAEDWRVHIAGRMRGVEDIKKEIID